LGFWIAGLGFVFISDDESEFPILVKSEFHNPKSEIMVTPILRFLGVHVGALICLTVLAAIYFGHK
jgi:hypothetical protein